MRSLAAFALALCVPFSASAEEASAADQPYLLQVRPGGIALICRTREAVPGKPRRTRRTIECPAGNAMCDDPAVAVPELTPKDGMGFRAKGPGSTLCSAAASSGVGPRRVYRVVVP